MIPTKPRRLKAHKLPKNLERQYKQVKCQDCSVVVTRMDFAKILGKFTKVKIQFESNSPKSKRTIESSPSRRLRNNENGMVQVQRSAYNPHPAKKLIGVTGRKAKTSETLSPRQAAKVNETSSPRQTTKSNETIMSRQTTRRTDTLLPRKTTKSNEILSPQQITKSNEILLPQPTTRKNETILARQTKRNGTLVSRQNTKKKENSEPQQTTFNVLKESNKLKKPVLNNLKHDVKKLESTTVKHYGIVFVNPPSKTKDVRSKIKLDSFLPSIDENILPSKEWSFDFFPKRGEPKDDKIYDRIAAELEDLMYNEKTKNNGENKDGKNDEFPSILDILNDNPKGDLDKHIDHSGSVHLESSDVEAMLLGKSKSPESLPMDIGNSDVNINSQTTVKMEDETISDDNPNSPSILDEPEPKEIPVLSVAEKPLNHTPKVDFTPTTSQSIQIDENDNTNTKNKNNTKSGITQVIFKKKMDGSSIRTVICPKNLKYEILIHGKSVELLGAPKTITNLEDLQVLLQIVDESELGSLHVTLT